MDAFANDINEKLQQIRELGLFRELRRVDSPQSPRIEINGKTLLNFSSNDYLGLANDPVLKQAAIDAINRYGCGAGASRLICGSLAPHHELEQTLAEFKACQAALSFASGYATATGAIPALVGKDDIVILDKLVHACIVDAARLSGAKLRVFAHNDLSELEEILKWADRQGDGTCSPQTRKRILIATESVFSMDGDSPALNELVTLKNRYGAWLLLDEAHATGIFGKNRRGLAEEAGIADQIEVQMGTLGKALGSAGGYICGSQKLIELLINRARTFIFSTAPPPAVAAAAIAGVRFVQSAAGEDRRHALWHRVQHWKQAHPQAKSCSPIIPIHVGAEDDAVVAANALREQGIFVPAIRHPTVARGQARLRVTLSAAHSADDLKQLASALASLDLPRAFLPDA